MWDLGVRFDPAALNQSPERPPPDIDPYGIEALRRTWRPPTLGGVRATASMDDLQVSKYVVVLTDKRDDFTFEVEGKLMWLGRVSRPGYQGGNAIPL
jgi:hypothetical protein